MHSSHSERFRWRAFFAISSSTLAASVIAAACSTSHGSTAELNVVVTSNLTPPGQLDHVRLIVSQEGRTLLLEERDLGPGLALLPTTFSLTTLNDASPVHADAVGSRGGVPQVERAADATVPPGTHASLVLPLDYLCSRYSRVGGAAQSCPADQTCIAGSCASDVVAPGALATIGGDGPPPTCFPTAECFASASDVVVDPISCSAAAPPAASPASAATVSVALHLSPYGAGVCDANRCLAVLDPGSEGWRWAGDRIQIPASICSGGGPIPPLSVTTACGAKQSGMPLCGPWSSVTSPEPVNVGAPGVDGGAPSGGCVGADTMPCDNCGTATRTCANGAWSAWSACAGAGECAPTTSRSCGTGGYQFCSNGCSWGPCGDQSCTGAASRTCGNCGTQRRTCEAGVWSEYGPCSDEGPCAPNATQACGAGGTQTCGGDCHWSACGSQSCVGPASQACGNCGTQTRTCNNNVWSPFGACTGEGECAPNATASCGAGGTKACIGACRWGECTGQTCSGSASQACGNCGTQTRTCTNGAWSAYGACTGQGECAPFATASCGTGGTKVCIVGLCTYSPCGNQSCSGAATEGCGMCGTHSRTCNNGTWSAYGACSGEGSCSPNATQGCGNGGTQSCGSNCQWGACQGQQCNGALSQACGNCGTQTRSCNNGVLSDFGGCSGEGCAPGATQGCGNGGTQTCGGNCQWGSCQGQSCSGAAPTRSCGNCNSGTQTATCNTSTGQYDTYGACGGAGCTPGRTRACNDTGTQTCAHDCAWGDCSL